MSHSTDICELGAVELRAVLARREVSAEEVTLAVLERIESSNQNLNAFCTVATEGARLEARAADKRLAAGGSGLLLGLPIGIKDLEPTRGMRTTFGSPIYRDFVPNSDSLTVRNIRRAGAVVVGKTNVPEFGAGSHTFNTLFGATPNPYDTTKTAGGSSGGSAVALAMRMVPLASGSDMGGSIRNPAAWNNICGLRPSLGRVPRRPFPLALTNFEVAGPLARTIKDVALLLEAMAGGGAYQPYRLPCLPDAISGKLGRDFKDVKIAISRDLGGRPIDTTVTDVLDKAFGALNDLGATVEQAHPATHDATHIFTVLRAHIAGYMHRKHIKNNPKLIKQTLLGDIERGLGLTALEVAEAEEGRVRLMRNFNLFLERYQFLCLPVTSVSPFPLELEFPEQVGGVRLSNYTDWMWPCYVLSLSGLPCASVPAGFDRHGMPVGMQIVGRWGDDLGVLQLAHAFEQSGGLTGIKPPLANRS